ncbi:MAG: hypothetical protein IPN90_02065 [Elusimicrobia bacterium]|nr:hypothetical protein [Elusimicrobiota bacterium]
MTAIWIFWVSGQQTTGTTRELRIYKNNGNGTISATQIEVDGAAGGLAEGLWRGGLRQ